MKEYTLFDIMGPIMIGPQLHTAGPFKSVRRRAISREKDLTR